MKSRIISITCVIVMVFSIFIPLNNAIAFSLHLKEAKQAW